MVSTAVCEVPLSLDEGISMFLDEVEGSSKVLVVSAARLVEL